MDVRFVIENDLWVAEVNGQTRHEIGDRSASIQAIVEAIRRTRPAVKVQVDEGITLNPFLRRHLHHCAAYGSIVNLAHIDMVLATEEPVSCGNCRRATGWPNPDKPINLGGHLVAQVQCFQCEAVKSWSDGKWYKKAAIRRLPAPKLPARTPNYAPPERLPEDEPPF